MCYANINYDENVNEEVTDDEIVNYDEYYNDGVSDDNSLDLIEPFCN